MLFELQLKESRVRILAVQPEVMEKEGIKGKLNLPGIMPSRNGIKLYFMIGDAVIQKYWSLYL